MFELIFSLWLAAAASEVDVSAELARCGAIADAAERVACFDALTSRVAEPVAEPAAPSSGQAAVEETAAEVAEEAGAAEAEAEAAAAAAGAAAVAAEPVLVEEPVRAPAPPNEPAAEAAQPEPASDVADFGLPPEREVQEKPQELTAAVVDVSRTASGKMVIRLDAQQVWVQKDNQRLTLKAGDEVRIKKGLGSVHYLSKLSGSRSIRVSRVE